MNKKLLILFTLLFSILSLMVYITLTQVSIGVIDTNDKDKYTLNNVIYLGYDDDYCYHMSCTAQLNFSDGVNTYKLTGHSHEMKNLVINSSYNVYYDNFSKEIKNFSFGNSIDN